MPHAINLHAHSHHSDGHASVLDMARACRDLGFCACVITDHVYGAVTAENHRVQLESARRFALLSDDAARTADTLGYPVLVGIEATVSGFAEVCLFGRAAIDELFRYRARHDRLPLELYARLRIEHDCAMCLCHPDEPAPFVAAGGSGILDAWEYIHQGQRSFDDDVPAYATLARLCNSDAHDPTRLGHCWNLAEEPLVSEERLIGYLRARRPFGHVVHPWPPPATC